VQPRILAIDAGGRPMTVPENMPKRTQKAMAVVVELARIQSVKIRTEQMS